MKKEKLNLKLIFILIILCGILLISNISNASEEILTYGNFNYYIAKDTNGNDSCIIESLVDYSIEELRIPANINGVKVTGFKNAEMLEDYSYDYILCKASNLKKLIIEDSAFNFGVTLSEKEQELLRNSSIKEIVIEDKNIGNQTSNHQLFYFDTSVKFYGYGHTRLQDDLEKKGYTYESLGETENIFTYSQSYIENEDGNLEIVEDKTHTVCLNTYVENLIVPEYVKILELIKRTDLNSTHIVDEFSEKTTAGIKTITFETKKAIKVIDQSYYKSLQTVYGYEGTGADTFAENVGAKFISLGKADSEIDQFNYEVVDGEYIAITGLNKTPAYKLEIPEYLDGLPVKVIKSNTISGNAWGKLAEVEEITIPSTVELVETEAFIGCNLKKLTIYSKQIEFLNKFEFFCAGYTISYSPIVYAYDESGMKDLVSEENYVSLNKKEILKENTKTNEAEVNGEKVTVLPTDAKTELGDFEKDKFIDNDYDIEIKNINGVVIASGKIGSRSIVTIKEKDTVLATYMVVVRGDVTGNGYVRMYDSFEILKDAVTGNKGLDEIDYLIRDYNEDGNIRMYDAFQYLREAVSGK